MKKIFSIFIFALLSCSLFADEGMWLPILIEKYNITDMQKKGFKLTAEDIYSINHASMKDAIVIFGGGCTGEMISNEGLLITNHHCGYGTIQRHSSVEHDYLTDGFWAMSRKEELASPGLTVTFLVSMEDVTDKVLEGVTSDMSDSDRATKILANMSKIKEESVKDTHYQARIESFYNGNQYFLFKNEIFEDVRLVGAPPSAIGKFGGDTDNWMWPRHTGDFSLFRVYCDKDGKPAKYSDDNIPYTPKKFFPISLKGVQEGDFTMVFGYPGTTQEYLPAVAVEQVMNESDPTRIAIRDKKLEVIKAGMEKSKLTRIQYSNKAASIANGWKKWQGEIKGLKRLDAVNVKLNFEEGFQKWANDKPEYKDLLNDYAKVYAEMKPLNLAYIYITEAILGSYAVSFANQMRMLESCKDALPESLQSLKEMTLSKSKGNYKDYDEQVEIRLFAEMTRIYMENMPKKYWPSAYSNIDKVTKSASDKYMAFAEYCFSKSVFANQTKFDNFVNGLSSKSVKTLTTDPIYSIAKEVMDKYKNEIRMALIDCDVRIKKLDRIYMKAQMEYEPQKRFFPDANFTLRVTYGQVTPYKPADGIDYEYFTTLDGIIEKDNPNIYDYKVPARLKELYEKKDYGRYADKDGKMHVAFTATNHTTGGNSGSPVINGNGELIGVNFDRNWEGTMSDIMYDPEMCRNISLDIRYALFLIDKFAGASHLIDEMEIRK
ncbi:MAG: S46 family peptidase [Bacteroidales bacterium]|nr:S46 family peptidase [Bacteroidales bacterium]